MIFDPDDIYYINLAVDFWLTEKDENPDADDKDVKTIEERCMTDD